MVYEIGVNLLIAIIGFNCVMAVAIAYYSFVKYAKTIKK